MPTLSRHRMLHLTSASGASGALESRRMAGDVHLIERFGISRRTLCRLCFSILLISYLFIAAYSNDTYAMTSELDDGYLSFVVAEIIEKGFPCSAADIGHILYEDDLITVLEIVCESGEGYEIFDIYNLDNVIIEPIEKMTEEEMDNYFNRISYSIT